MTDLEKRRARVSGGEIAYVDEGSGPPVVLLHGFPSSSFLWREYVPMLAAGMRVIAPDLLGHGDSEKPEGTDIHIRAQAAYVRELLGGLGIEEFAVVGHSHGGGIAQLLALDGAVRAMVLLDSAAFDEWPSPAVRDVQALPPEREGEVFVETILATAFGMGMVRWGELGEEVAREYFRPFSGPEGARAFFRGARACDGRGLTGREAELGRLDIPVLIVWGEEDPFFPQRVAERLHDAIPSSTLALVPGCSHFVTEDAGETLGPLIYEYLRSRYLGQAHGHPAASGAVPVKLERRRGAGKG